MTTNLPVSQFCRIPPIDRLSTICFEHYTSKVASTCGTADIANTLVDVLIRSWFIRIEHPETQPIDDAVVVEVMVTCQLSGHVLIVLGFFFE